MLRDHPPHDVRGLGIEPPPDRSRGYRATAIVLWAAFLLVVCSLAALPRSARGQVVTQGWPLLVLVFIVWQAALIWLFLRLIEKQMPEGPRRGSGTG